MSRARWISAVLLLCFAVSLHLYSESPGARYAEDRCQMRAIYEQEGHIHLAAIGSSRAMRGFTAGYLHDAIQAQRGEDWVIYDLSRGQRGMGHNYILIRDLLERRSVGRLLVEYNTRHSLVYHRLYYLKATTSDLIGHMAAEPSRPWAVRLAQSLRWWLERVAKRFELMLRGKFYSTSWENPKPASVTDCSPGKRYVEPDVLHGMERRRDDFIAKGRSWDFDEPGEARNSHYVARIIELAEQHGVEIDFIHYVGRYTTRLDPSFIAQFEARFGRRLIQPPLEQVLEWFKEDSYYDTSHMSPVGSAHLMNYVAGQL